ncbi:MAG TPA: hypothetical protein VMF63_13425 [Opitutaceae bacterium]|nr:hypothetical protein [Opitutaceae bacterium]
MDYEKLARTLLRILGIWLIAQSLPSLIFGGVLAMQMGSSPMTRWTYSTMGGSSLLVGGALIYLSAKLAKAIST